MQLPTLPNKLDKLGAYLCKLCRIITIHFHRSHGGHATHWKNSFYRAAKYKFVLSQLPTINEQSQTKLDTQHPCYQWYYVNLHLGKTFLNLKSRRLLNNVNPTNAQIKMSTARKIGSSHLFYGRSLQMALHFAILISMLTSTRTLTCCGRMQ